MRVLSVDGQALVVTQKAAAAATATVANAAANPEPDMKFLTQSQVLLRAGSLSFGRGRIRYPWKVGRHE